MSALTRPNREIRNQTPPAGGMRRQLSSQTPIAGYRGKLARACDNCGLVFFRHHSILAKQATACCSKACMGELKHKLCSVEVACTICGTNYVTKQSRAVEGDKDRSVTCSLACSIKRQSIDRTTEERARRYEAVRKMRAIGHTYPQIAAALGLPSTQAAEAAIKFGPGPLAGVNTKRPSRSRRYQGLGFNGAEGE